MDISFDPARRAEALAERGLDFADAGLLFEGDTVTVQDNQFGYDEPRLITAGYLRGRCVAIV